jgi:hypothetical protein
MTILFSDNPATAEVCLNLVLPKLALNVIFPWGRSPTCPARIGNSYSKGVSNIDKNWL